MKLSCPDCGTGHNVSGRPTGTQLTCSCGTTFTLPIAVTTLVSVQCQGCGANTDPGSGRCDYCDDVLRVVCCPSCFSLMAADDKHCAQCGISVSAPALALHRHGQATLPCPRCSCALTANLVGRDLFDRCDRCGGVWAHHLALASVFCERGQRYSVSDWLHHSALPDQAAIDSQPRARCPDCEQLMERRVVCARDSAMLPIDSCNDHGIWFDFRELRSIVGERPRRRKNVRRTKVHRGAGVAPFLDDLDDWWPFEAIEDLLEFLEDLLD